MCPNQESNPRPFGEQVDAQPAEPPAEGKLFKLFLWQKITQGQQIKRFENRIYKSEQKVQKTFTNWQEKDYLEINNRNIGDLWTGSFKEPKNMKDH